MNGRKSFAPIEFKLSEEGSVIVGFSRFDVLDHDRDITRKSAIPVGISVAMSNFGHSSWDAAPPVGKGELGVTDEMATFTGSFFMSTDQGRNAYHTVKEMGDLQEWSYGFNVLDSGPITFNGVAAREIKKLDIFEVSPVLKGAGVGTHTIAIKSDGPGIGPYAERASWYLEHVPALIEWTEDRDAFRKGEGRSLSHADRERLEDIASSWLAHADAIWHFLAEPTDTKADDAAKRSLMVEIERARALGIPI